ncbi:MAG: YraN family protein [Bacillota bacterium]|nr:YraN family protein [Bacillota bacterium]
MSDARRAAGISGENLAATALQQAGYTIVERNYRCKMGEIDIIAAKGKTLFFVEVKARHSSTFAAPRQNINAAKIRHIRNTATDYFQKHGGESMSAFIIAEVDLESGRVELIEDSFC